MRRDEPARLIATSRPCMLCHKLFLSNGFHHRFCSVCQPKVQDEAAIRIRVIAPSGKRLLPGVGGST